MKSSAKNVPLDQHDHNFLGRLADKASKLRDRIEALSANVRDLEEAQQDYIRTKLAREGISEGAIYKMSPDGSLLVPVEGSSESEPSKSVN